MSDLVGNPEDRFSQNKVHFNYLLFCVCNPCPNLGTWPTTDLRGIPDWVPNDVLVPEAGRPMLDGLPLASEDRLRLPLVCLLLSVRTLRGPREDRSVEFDLLDIICKNIELMTDELRREKTCLCISDRV